ncbi:MAG: dephospho-CoA kinase, partial [Sulfobacillus thermosulfidooxidans]
MRVVGLTGGIGSGKSEVSRILKELGAPVIDADALTHQCQRRGQLVWRAVWDRYGWGILGPDGELLRRKLGHIIFHEASEREALNRIVHPAVKRQIQERLAELERQGSKVVVLDI